MLNETGLVLSQNQVESLRIEVLELSAQKDELLRVIDEYNDRYNLEFKDILAEILYLRKENRKKNFNLLKHYYTSMYQEYQKEKDEISYLKEKRITLSRVKDIQEIDKKISKHIEILKRFKREIENLGIKKVKQDYLKSHSNLDQFKNAFEQEDKKIEYTLSEKEDKELKTLYKKAAHMCHPDIVLTSKKEDAQDIFQELNKAYINKDLKLIQEIVLFLGNGELFNKNLFHIGDESFMLKALNELKLKKETIQESINFIKHEHEFSFIFSIDDEKEYFKSIKSNLLQLLGELKSHKIDPIKNSNEEWIKQIYRYANKYKISNKIIPRNSNLLKKLTTLDLSSNNLLYITSAISNLEFLETLNLSNNNLINFPDELSKLINLKELNISRNKFDNIPKVIFDIKSLKKLDISKNNLHDIPKEIKKNNNLYYLDLGGNFIRTLSEEICTLKSLKVLSLWGNRLSHIPDNITRLKSLEELKLGSNNLKTLPKNITELLNLNNLEVFMNHDLVLCKKQKKWQLDIDDSLFLF
ncbi:MAG: Leucine-rich repeat (LRR) protein [Sulfurimonas sp.]|jgi:Leucine-rich repeat (LRR) protein